MYYASIRWKIPWRDDGMMPTPGAGENTGEPPELPTELEVPSELQPGDPIVASRTLLQGGEISLDAIQKRCPASADRIPFLGKSRWSGCFSSC